MRYNKTGGCWSDTPFTSQNQLFYIFHFVDPDEKKDVQHWVQDLHPRLNNFKTVNKTLMGKAARADKNFPVVNVSVSEIDPDIFFRETEAEDHEYKGKRTLDIVKYSLEEGEIQPNTLLNNDGRFCTIQGEGGAGKSTVMNKMFIESAKENISILIELAKLHRNKYSLQSLIEEYLMINYKIRPEIASEVYACLEKNSFKMNIFLDGLDQTPWSLLKDKTDHLPRDKISKEQLITNIVHRDTN